MFLGIVRYTFSHAKDYVLSVRLNIYKQFNIFINNSNNPYNVRF